MTDTLKLRLTNNKAVETTFVLEPYGDFWPMAAGATYELRLEIEGNEPRHYPEIVMTADAIIVYSGVAGHVSVWQDEREINSSDFSPQPLQRAA